MDLGMAVWCDSETSRHKDGMLGWRGQVDGGEAVRQVGQGR